MPLTAGLENRGNTCYISSALQALAHCPPFLSFFLYGGAGAIEAAVRSGQHRPPAARASELPLQLLRLLGDMLDAAERRKRLSPAAFVATVRSQNALFAGYEQHVRWMGWPDGRLR